MPENVILSTKLNQSILTKQKISEGQFDMKSGTFLRVGLAIAALIIVIIIDRWRRNTENKGSLGYKISETHHA